MRLADERASATSARLEQAEKELERFREQERSLAEALVWARHTASDLSEKAEQEAERIVQEAERRAAEMVSESQREIERLSGERERLESLAHELQEDLTAFLRGTLERLNGEMESKTVPDESVA